MKIIYGILYFGYFRYFCNYEILISIITRDVSRESYIFVNIVKEMESGWKIVLYIKYYGYYTWNIILWLF